MSKHVKIDWLLRSYPTYIYFKMATVDLIRTIGAEPPVELELSPHSLTYRGADDEIIRTYILKTITTKEDAEDVLTGLIESLTCTPT